MQKENKIDCTKLTPIFGKMFSQHNKVHFVPNLLSQILILDKGIPDLLFFNE